METIKTLKTEVKQRKVSCYNCRFFPKQCGYWEYGKLDPRNFELKGHLVVHNCQDFIRSGRKEGRK